MAAVLKAPGALPAPAPIQQLHHYAYRARDAENGTLTLHAEAYGPNGSRKVVEVTVARTSSTEIERGQIAQRGQEELNQRSRKAAVQTPGQKLTNMRMNTSTGNLVVQ